MTAITAIVPTYDRAAFLDQALAALAAQTRPVAEILIWDDGSTDGTADLAAAWTKRDHRVRAFRGDNAGKSRALNRAMEEARGDVIWICDDDDLSRPDAAERMAAAMEATGAPVVGGSYERFGIDPATGAAVAADPGYRPDLSSGSMLRHLLEDIFVFQNATLATRAAYGRVGPFREDLPRSIDYDMIVRLASRHPVAYVDAPLFDQRKHEGARGPAAARHEATRMEAVWREADQRVFRDFWDTLPVSLYEAMFEAADPRLVSRAARLQRGAVYARRNLWDLAADEFEAAARADAPAGLTAEETAIAIRAMAGKHGCAGAFEPSTKARLAALKRSGETGAAIAAALGRGLRWRLRDAVKTRDAAAAMRLAGLSATLGWRARPPLPDGLAERDELPAAAYSWT
ncbi:MAG: glycosyltransferase family 2 protein [Pseudomonadota bacterium]